MGERAEESGIVQTIKPHIKAEVRLLPTEHGGRINPIISGYRPSLDLGLEGMQNCCVIQVVDADSIAPGSQGTITVSLIAPDFQIGRLHIGMEFDLCEGHHILGKGTIIEIYDERLQRKSNE